MRNKASPQSPLHHRQVEIESVLYLRGEREAGDLQRYLRGLRAGGLRNVQGREIPNSGHFTSDEQPKALLAVLREFMGLLSETATSHERIA